MKYVLFVLFTALGQNGAIEKTQFEIEMSSRAACLAAVEETRQELTARYPNALALSVECRPETMFDEPISMNEFRQQDVLAAD